MKGMCSKSIWKMEITMRKILKYPFIVIVVMIVGVLSSIQLTKESTKFSDWENRYLEQKPKFTMESYLDSSFGKAYETYVNEQFPMRKQWIQVKAVTEQILGKVENNDIIKGQDGYLFSKQLFVSEQLEKNIRKIEQFANRSQRKIYVGVIPNSYSILREKLPKGTPNINQDSYIRNLNKSFGENKFIHVVPIQEILAVHKEEPIYYRTDHHWTTLGAFYGYQQVCEEMNINSIDESQLESCEINDFYGTLDAKYKGIDVKPDKIIYYQIPIQSMSVNGRLKDSLYDMKKAKTRDKYGMFLYGNNGLTIIRSGYRKVENKKNKKKLLIAKDSFSNSLIPFLTFQFDEIYVVDLRYFLGSISSLLKENEIDSILFLYNFDTLSTDNHFYRLK
ncbi:hypothetical protein FYJ58_13880 [Lachnospiraceae bacterium WCA-693-APC-MOT-I]|uniref:DHHW protein n=2 Tax=Velocimicrobium porci TaxID=2606634 RepID=A0A6L5Y1Y6_9FIRM|nr:hypothetical protein [Velocimicrobium porci]